MRASLSAHGCAIALRGFTGPFATELFLQVSPVEPTGAADQAERIYRAAAEALSRYGGGLSYVVRQTVFYQDIGNDAKPVAEARKRVVDDAGDGLWYAATMNMQQPPLSRHSRVEVLLHAAIPTDRDGDGFKIERPGKVSSCDGIIAVIGDDQRMYDSNLCGSHGDAYQQTLDMFELAQRRLNGAGLSFEHVVRTWIYLRDIEQDYPVFNRARREFFDSHGIVTAPASTGIAGTPAGSEHRLSMGLYAVSSPQGPRRTVMSAPTLNEAASYGADFVRGMRVDESNRVALHLSGTASVNEKGETAHPGDLEAQAARMVVNLRALLAPHDADFSDVVSAITYVKHPEDAERLRQALSAEGFEGFPNPVVHAAVCRDDLLCECELLALKPPVDGHA